MSVGGRVGFSGSAKMVKKLGTKKNRSNRLTIRQRKKQMKKAVMHNAAARKAAKFAKMGGSRLSKDPGIPNLWPFKEKLLKRAERDREKAEAAAELMKEKKARERAKRKKEIKKNGAVDTMAALAAERARIYEARMEKQARIHGGAEKWEAGNKSNRDAASARKTRRQYFTMMQQLVKKADIIIEVLDARDPAGCRAPVSFVRCCHCCYARACPRAHCVCFHAARRRDAPAANSTPHYFANRANPTPHRVHLTSFGQRNPFSFCLERGMGCDPDNCGKSAAKSCMPCKLPPCRQLPGHGDKSSGNTYSNSTHCRH